MCMAPNRQHTMMHLLHSRMSCWKCGERFQTQKLLKNHMTSIHGSMTVVCTFCEKSEQRFKRVSDLKVHARKVHQAEMETIPTEFYSENNGYWCSIYPGDYIKLVRPTSRSNPAAVKMRTAVLDWTKKMGSKTSKSRQAFLDDWQKTEAGPAFTLTSEEEDDSFDYFDIEDEPKLVYINLIPGAIFADIEKGLDKFRLLISDELFRETLSLRSLSRRMSSLQPSSLPFGAVDLQDDSSQEIKDHLSKFLSIKEDLVQKILSKRVILKRALTSPKKDTALKKLKPSIQDLNIASQKPLLVGDTAGRAIPQKPTGLPKGDFVETPLPEVPATTTVTNLDAAGLSRDWSPLQLAVPLGSRAESPLRKEVLASSHPASSTVLQAACTSTENRQVSPSFVRKTASTAPKPVVSSSDSSAPVPRKIQGSLPPPPSQDYRATKLLKLGGMPHWQPARRAWDQDEAVSLVEKDITIFWPPKGWKNLTPQQKLMQWEFAALSILKARGEDYINIHQADLLDSFNFLALPGTAAHKTPKSLPSYLMIKSRLFNYETLRSIANGELKDEKWLSMLEAGAMMRDTSNDKLLKICTNIKLRLIKD